MGRIHVQAAGIEGISNRQPRRKTGKGSESSGCLSTFFSQCHAYDSRDGRHPRLRSQRAATCANASRIRIAACAGYPFLAISEIRRYASISIYNWGMSSLQEFIDSQLTQGRAYFSKQRAFAELGQTPQAFPGGRGAVEEEGPARFPTQGILLNSKAGGSATRCSRSIAMD